jgi:hypothetical protein
VRLSLFGGDNPLHTFKPAYGSPNQGGCFLTGHFVAHTLNDRSKSSHMDFFRCEDTGWVCEAHIAKPWSGPRTCGCGAAGAPFGRCNASQDIPRLPEVDPKEDRRHQVDPTKSRTPSRTLREAADIDPAAIQGPAAITALAGCCGRSDHGCGRPWSRWAVSTAASPSTFWRGAPAAAFSSG